MGNFKIGQQVKFGKENASVIRASDGTLDLQVEDKEQPKGYRFETNIQDGDLEPEKASSKVEVRELTDKESAKAAEEAANVANPARGPEVSERGRTTAPETQSIPTPAKAQAKKTAAPAARTQPAKKK